MSEKDDVDGAIGRSTVKGSGEVIRRGKVVYDAATSMADAIVSVTPTISRSDMDAFQARLNALDMAQHKLIAEGMITPGDVEIATTLPDKVVKAMSEVAYQNREVRELREHQKELAEINSSGPVRAENVKGIWIVIGLGVSTFVGWLVGRFS
jgi:hypothetical protein